jgi:hypothetical protein
VAEHRCPGMATGRLVVQPSRQLSRHRTVPGESSTGWTLIRASAQARSGFAAADAVDEFGGRKPFSGAGNPWPS